MAATGLLYHFNNDKLTCCCSKDGEGNVTSGDASAVLSITGSNASGILEQNGALHMVTGESNRMEKSKNKSVK